MTGRRVLLTDLLALVAHNGNVYPNEAMTRERLAGDGSSVLPSDLPLERLLPFVGGRKAWISARRQRLLALVSARRRGGRSAWEIDCLIDTTDAGSEAADLLECAIADAGRAGAEKVFLRLPEQSRLLPAVKMAGFLPYVEETLYVRETPLRGEGLSLDLRPFTQQDVYPVYRLYNCWAPESVRRNEAATFGEWNASLERRWVRNGVQLIAEREGRTVGLVRAARLPQGTEIEVMVDDGDLDSVSGLAVAAVAAADGRPPFLVLVPAYAGGIAQRLEAAGFQPSEEYVSLVRRTTVPLKLPKLKAAMGKTAVTA